MTRRKHGPSVLDVRARPLERVRELAELVLQVARLHPRKRRRTGYLRANAPDLAGRLAEHGFIELEPVEEPDEFDGLCTAVQDDTADKVQSVWFQWEEPPAAMEPGSDIPF
jgi:hypothetical protein